MDMVGIFSQAGLAFLARWAHFLAGITWIGILYYFNLVQVPAFAEMEVPARSEALRKITFRALWWFRWGAALTLLSGLTILGLNGQFTHAYFQTVAGVSIATGALLGIIMFSNVWFVIWPAQKIAIGSAEAVAAGGTADPGAAAAGRRGLVASRTNTLLSIPMLFFMAAASHFVTFGNHFAREASSSHVMMWWGTVVVLAGAIELNALGTCSAGWDRAGTRSRSTRSGTCSSPASC